MKPLPPARPVLPVEALHPFLGKELLGGWKDFRRRWRKCRSKPSESAVHALRVEARRLLAELELLTGLGLEPLASPIREPIRKLLSALSKLRDTQVQRELLKAWRAEFADRTWLERELRRLVRRQRRRVTERLEEFPAPELTAAVRALAKVVRSRGKEASVRSRDAKRMIQTVERSFARVQALQQGMRTEAPATFHAVRVAFKAFRYQVEFLAPQLGIADADYLDGLRQFQSHFGEFNDADVWGARLTQLQQEHPKRVGLAKLRRAVAAKAKRLLDRCVVQSRRVGAFWPPPSAPVAQREAAQRRGRR